MDEEKRRFVKRRRGRSKAHLTGGAIRRKNAADNGGKNTAKMHNTDPHTIAGNGRRTDTLIIYTYVRKTRSVSIPLKQQN